MFYYRSRSTKVEQFYDTAMDLYFNKGVGATQIVRQLPLDPIFTDGFVNLQLKTD